MAEIEVHEDARLYVPVNVACGCRSFIVLSARALAQVLSVSCDGCGLPNAIDVELLVREMERRGGPLTGRERAGVDDIRRRQSGQLPLFGKLSS